MMWSLIIALAGFAALPLSTSPTPEIDYTVPGELIAVEGKRRMNLRCAGAGGPTIVLIPGLGDSTIVWHLVQPELAKTNRVCAWDRAGFGFSDGSPHPQTAEQRAIDLDRTLRKAHVNGPLILVGHSLGSYETLIFADHHLKRLTGMVLVDPAIPDQAVRLATNSPAFGAYAISSFNTALESAARCATAIKGGTLKPGDPDPDGCFQYPDYYPAALKQKLAQLDSQPERSATQLDLYRNDATREDSHSAALLNPRRNYGDVPLIVLSAGTRFRVWLGPKAPADVIDQSDAAQAQWLKAHDELAALSTHGVSRIVPGARHNIELTNPEAVVQAIEEVADAARKA